MFNFKPCLVSHGFAFSRRGLGNGACIPKIIAVEADRTDDERAQEPCRKACGDGLQIEFQSTIDGVKCAVECQTNFEEQKRGAAVSFRIGVNAGDIAVDGDVVLGNSANVAARPEASGALIHVVLLDAVHQQFNGTFDATFFNDGASWKQAAAL